mmetsp:Transcript_43763/g.108279  ORF Transcript_43763/g.108279 Transcript_43763/m.108279 type:complete len:176 (+) Transcript_43763:223-750(+)
MGAPHDTAMSSSAEPYTFSLLLRAEDAVRRSTWVRDRRRVVLLHGWLQDHASWLSTAHHLRRQYGHSVLLLDWLHHGRSETPTDPAALSPDALVRQLRSTLEHICWAGPGQPSRLTIGGCSLGGAVAMMYTNLYPQDVDRLVLVAPAGFNEPWYRVITHAGRFSANALIRSTRCV